MNIQVNSGLWLIFAALSLDQELSAGVSLGLSGNINKNHLGLETSKSQGFSANVSFDLSDNLRLGLSHRRATDSGGGLKSVKDSSGQENYVSFSSLTRTITNALDLIVVLYNGSVSPYLFGGVAQKSFFSTLSCEYICSTKPSQAQLFPVPNYGFGVGFYISKDFSVKLSQTYSPGILTVTQDGSPQNDPESGKEKSRYVLDTYTQIGLSYHL